MRRSKVTINSHSRRPPTTRQGRDRDADLMVARRLPILMLIRIPITRTTARATILMATPISGGRGLDSITGAATTAVATMGAAITVDSAAASAGKRQQERERSSFLPGRPRGSGPAASLAG